ncbi:UNVERIFIED_CONTAM: hypothetical protein FKN15_019696 [Acipenser sinensis]
MNATESFLTTEDYYNYDELAKFMLCNKSSVIEFASWFLPTLYTLVFIFGLIGNGLVVCVLIQYKKLRSMTDVYLLNLAVSDLLFVFSLPFWSSYAAVSHWVFGAPLCKIISGFYLIGFYSGIFFLTIMSIDRFLAIVYAVTAMRFRSVSHGVFVSVAVWAISLCASLPTIVFSQVKNESGLSTCNSEYPEGQYVKWKLINNFELNILGLLLPFFIMVYCYSRIIQTLRVCRSYKKEKAVRLIFIVVIVFFLFWTPYNIVLFLESLQMFDFFSDCDSSNNLEIAMQCTETLAFVHCCLNPVIYAFAGQEFKKCVRKMLYKCTSYCSVCKQCKMISSVISEPLSSTYSRSSGEPCVTRVL